MDEDIVMTTGAAQVWNWGNRRPDTGEIYYPELFPNNHYEPGDAELEQKLLILNSTLDSATLEFDIYCENGQLEFEYQFGSDEYDEYIGQFNDAIIAAINGVIVSLTPDAELSISVNSVNHHTRSHLYMNHDIDIFPNVPTSKRSERVEYDGMVIKLKSRIFVTPGRTYRMRIVIADVFDDRVDSALFINKGSLRSCPVLP